MRRQGYRETTIHFSVKSLIWVAKRTNLLEPETVKACLASAKTSEARKRTLVEDLVRFYKFKNIPFDRPRFRRVVCASSGTKAGGSRNFIPENFQNVIYPPQATDARHIRYISDIKGGSSVALV